MNYTENQSNLEIKTQNYMKDLCEHNLIICRMKNIYEYNLRGKIPLIVCIEQEYTRSKFSSIHQGDSQLSSEDPPREHRFIW